MTPTTLTISLPILVMMMVSHLTYMTTETKPKTIAGILRKTRKTKKKQQVMEYVHTNHKKTV
jgi:hypothetical protein